MARILVIEDETAIRDNIIETLQLEGHEAGGAENGLVGVEIARRYLPDLIICDIMMPELDGYGVLAELRGDPATATIPFVFLTARVDRASTRRGMELGADDYLTKPFTPTELLATVKTRLEKHYTLIQIYEKKLETLRNNIIHALPHELRTPLGGILGCADLLVMDYENIDPSRVLSLSQIILNSANRLQHLIENYLVYAQIELLATNPDRVSRLRSSQTLNSDYIVSSVAAEKAEQVERAADLCVEAQPLILPISEDNFQKIVSELVSNAFKFSKSGTEVAVRSFANDGVYILSIRDYGRGMTPEQIKSIGAYQQFERTIYEQQGMGLGLIIARRLAELHGGELIVESIPGQMTEVTVRLPL